MSQNTPSKPGLGSSASQAASSDNTANQINCDLQRKRKKANLLMWVGLLTPHWFLFCVSATGFSLVVSLVASIVAIAYSWRLYLQIDRAEEQAHASNREVA
ncbi:MAG: hypothetical protein EPN60_16980 [Nevskiaceae bacterium]|nr:MAG: hypothetical protein EPN60_16980 [Nevskiaceae bacterium]